LVIVARRSVYLDWDMFDVAWCRSLELPDLLVIPCQNDLRLGEMQNMGKLVHISGSTGLDGDPGTAK
jgi:hypothetical protein